MEYGIGTVIGAVVGYLINRISKSIVNLEEDKISEYGLSKWIVMIVIVIFTVAIFFKFNPYESPKYLFLGYLLFMVGIIDYYTQFVYLKTIILGGVLVILSVICFRGQLYISSAIGVGIYLSVAAFLSGKWYGDVQVIALITLVIGYPGLLPVILVASILGIGILILKKGKFKELAFCPLILIGYLVFLIIC
ncbi:MAG: hypothetical protein RSA57_03710 [Cetobacterium sp.]|uniref:hypothetical protein n=1 Tax=Bacteria TaxID=2 RepID=UPI002FC83E7D